MEVKQISCQNCGATLNVEIGRPKGFCQFCGSQYILETDNPSENVDIMKLYEQAIKAERSRMYDEVIKLYDKMLSVNPTFEPGLIGKAFATLANLQDNVGNIEYFKGLFEQAVAKAEKVIDKETLHIMILDKVWSIKHFLLEANMKNLHNDTTLYINNLVLVNDIQMYINEYISKVEFDNPHDTYKMNYRQLKKDIIDFGDSIINMSKRFRTPVPYKWREKSYLNEIKENMKQAEKDLKIFNKKFK